MNRSNKIGQFWLVCPRHFDVVTLEFHFRNVQRYDSEGITLYGYKCPECDYPILLMEKVDVVASTTTEGN